MITFDAAPDHVLAARAEGRLTKEDIQAFVDEIDARLARHEQIGIVTDVTGLDGMTFGGLVEDFRSEFRYLGQWHRFPKVALIADDGFLKGFAETIGPVVPQIEMRIFDPGHHDAAIAFAAEIDPQPAREGDASEG